MVNSSPSSSSSSSSPTPPPEVQVGPGGSSVGGESEEGCSSRKKKAGSNDQQGDEEGVQKRLKRGEMDSPISEPVCCICNKKFGSWKGVFGHMRAHPEREWRGAFPPPKEKAGAININHQQILQQQLAPTLLSLGREALARMTNHHGSGAANAAAPSRRAGDTELNREQQELAGPSTIIHPSLRGFDLNLPPPPEEANEDDRNN